MTRMKKKWASWHDPRSEFDWRVRLGRKKFISTANHRCGGSPSDTMLRRTEEVLGPSGSFPSSHNDKDYNEEEPK